MSDNPTNFNWLPIKGAPKDGTVVILANSNEMAIQYWGEDADGDKNWVPRVRGFTATHYALIGTLPN